MDHRLSNAHLLKIKETLGIGFTLRQSRARDAELLL